MNRRPENEQKATKGQCMPRRWERSPSPPVHQLTSYHVREGLKMKIRPENEQKTTKGLKNEKQTTKGLKMNRIPQKAWEWTEDHKRLENEQKTTKGLKMNRRPRKACACQGDEKDLHHHQTTNWPLIINHIRKGLRMPRRRGRAPPSHRHQLTSSPGWPQPVWSAPSYRESWSATLRPRRQARRSSEPGNTLHRAVMS